MAKKLNVNWPDNLSISGVLSFPIKSEAEIEALKEWRSDRKIKKPKYPDKIGASLLVTDPQIEKATAYLDEYLDFVNVLYKESDGEKGLDPDQVKELKALVKARDWSNSNFPIRNLTDKDIENNGGDDCKFTGKIKFSGPYEDKMHVKAIVRPNPQSKIQVVQINELEDYGFELPEKAQDPDQLWWGAGWNFKTSMRFNAFEAATGIGVTAYNNTLYLLPHLGLPMGSYDADADIIEDGDIDFED